MGTQAFLKAGYAGVAAALVVAVQTHSAEPSVEDLLAEDFKIPLWEESFNLRAGFGYKDNVLLSGTEPQGSAFWAAGGDVMIFRLPTRGWWFHLLVSADNTGYFDRSIGVDNEQVVVGAAQVARDLGRQWKTGIGLNYLFQNQVCDVTATETNRAEIGEVVGHNFTGRWFVRKKIQRWWAEAEVNLTRQLYESPLDDFWQTGPRLAVGRDYGRGSEVTLSYRWDHLSFDTRETVDTQGYANPGTDLRFQEHSVDLAWHHVWDRNRRWHTTARASLETNEDNGSGYFDFWRYRGALQAQYRARSWEASAHLRLALYDYPVQPVSPTDPELREKTLLTAGVRGQKTLAKRWKVYAQYSHDQSLSNLAFDDYSANTVSAGVDFQF